MTYVGELGWELYMPTEFVGQIFDLLAKEGEAYGISTGWLIMLCISSAVKRATAISAMTSRLTTRPSKPVSNSPCRSRKALTS